MLRISSSKFQVPTWTNSLEEIHSSANSLLTFSRSNTPTHPHTHTKIAAQLPTFHYLRSQKQDMKKLIRVTTIPLSLDKLLGEQLRFMNGHFDLTAVAAEEEELKRVARKYGVKHFHVEMTRQITPIKDLQAVWKMYRFLRKESPEIIHTHTPKAGLVGMLAGFLAGVPVRAHTVAGLPLLETSGAKRKVLNFVEWFTYRCATHVYPNSFAMRDIIIKEGFCAPGKLKVLGNGSSNGIDTQYFSNAAVPPVAISTLREELGITADDFVFIFVGRLVGDKGINELVEAFSKLVEAERKVKVKAEVEDVFVSFSGRSVKLLLVGPLETELDALKPETLQEIQQHPSIISVGYQDDVRPYFAIADALAFPSYREGFPNVVLQAGAMELPAIVTDINGCNEIISEEENGLIIPVKDAEALQAAMEKIITDQAFYHRMKENARPMIESRYRQEVVWQALLEEYASAVCSVNPASLSDPQ